MTHKTNNEKWVMSIRCSCHCTTCSTETNSFTDSCCNTYTNNCKNNRHGTIGKHGKIRQGALLSKQKDMVCPFHLTIYQDQYGFYVRSNSCNPYHKFHPKRNHLCTPKSLIHGNELENLNDSHDAATQAGTGRNLHYVRSKRRKNIPSLLSTRQVSQIW